MLGAGDHGVLATVHRERGVDAVPVVYAVWEGFVGVPVDRVKPKASTLLQRERNLRADPRATLVIEHWDRLDWSALWWVRASLRFEADPPASTEIALADRLAASYPQYAERPFVRVLVLRITGVTGWSGVSDPGDQTQEKGR